MTRLLRVIALLTLLAAILILRLSSNPHSANAQALPERSAKSSISKFIWVGRENGQFSQEEIYSIATNFDLVTIAKFHAGGDRNLHHEDTRRLMAENSSLKVLAYFGASYRFRFDTYGKDTFNTDWYLINRNTGKPVLDGDGNHYVDLSKPAYRNWATGIIVEWVNAAPYSGVAFDNANIFLYEKPWTDILGKQKIDDWNQGLRNLLTETKSRLGNKLVIFNGLDESKNVELLNYSDGGMNEKFCVNRIHTTFFKSSVIDSNLLVMKTYTGKNKLILLKSNYFPRNDTTPPPTQKEKENIGRYCLGNFLLAADPKLDFFKSGPGYHAELGEINENAQEINLRLGNPVANFSQDRGIYKRPFSSGWVFVNKSLTPQTLALPQTLVLANGGVMGKTYAGGQTYTIPPEDAAYFLKP